MRRRRVLTALAAATGLTAGCPGESGSVGGGATERPQSTAVGTATAEHGSGTPTLEGPAVPAQSITVENVHADATFVTVVVERAGEAVFTESRELVAGERYVASDVLDVGGTYDVIVETAAGERESYAWTVESETDGLGVTLGHGVEFVRTVLCGPDCEVAIEGEGTVPLVGDGTGQWYAPAQVVLANPSHGTARTARLAVSLYGESVLDYRYRVPPETELAVPITYRSGTYDVVVETDGRRIDGEWRVPEEPSRVVDLATGTVGCGAANTELRLVNRDDTAHRLTVTIARDGRTVFSERFTMAPDSSRSVVPVVGSGRYEARVRTDADPAAERTAQWWACPPHGPATVLVDATGTVTLRQAGLRVSGESQRRD